MARIGLLEDDAGIIKMCVTLLELVGHQVVVYERPHECLHALLVDEKPGESAKSTRGAKNSYDAYDVYVPGDTLPVDVLILDLFLPAIDGKNGMYVLRQLTTHPRTQALPLIVSTAAKTEIPKVLQIAPHVAIVIKPFKIQTLITTISTALAAVAH